MAFRSLNCSLTIWAALAAALLPGAAAAQEATPSPTFDAARAAQYGADEHGMRRYVLVILKTSPKPLPPGEQRDAMFRGHFANMQRLAKEGKLAYAGPLDGKEGWRGLFILAVADIEEARKITETDPVIMQGEMVAEYHAHYGTAALMGVNAVHETLQKTPF